MSEKSPLFETRYPARYIGLLTFYIWCTQMLIFFTSLYMPSYWSGDQLGFSLLAQMATILSMIGFGFSAAFYYGSKLIVTEQGIEQSWLWGAITTELKWDKIAYHSSNKLPGIEYHTLKDKDDPSVALHIDIPISLDNYESLNYHLERRGINLEYGQVLRLAQPPRPITEILRDNYPQQYQGPR
jgi:hypothetical protein